MKLFFIKLTGTNVLPIVAALIIGLYSTSPIHAEEAKPSAPAGTHIMVNLQSALDSRQHNAGHKFTAVLEGDIVSDGKVIAPRGTTVYGQLVAAQKSGRLAGKSEMQITLTHIMINNQLHPVVTSGVKAVTENTAKNTVGKTARAAAIGGMIDGSKGAKTGAKVGAGASLLTSGNQINIPAGTLLDFTLAAPLTP